MSLLAVAGQVAHYAVGLSVNPLAILGLVPVFAAGLLFMRYVSVDPESHPVNINKVTKFLIILFYRIWIFHLQHNISNPN